MFSFERYNIMLTSWRLSAHERPDTLQLKNMLKQAISIGQQVLLIRHNLTKISVSCTAENAFSLNKIDNLHDHVLFLFHSLLICSKVLMERV